MVPKTPTKTTQVTEVKLPEWVDAAAQQNYAKAQQVAAKPYTPYKGQTVAGTPQTTLDAYEMFKKTLGTGSGDVSAASDLMKKAGGGILGMDRAAYTNPFTDEVEKNALRALDESRQKSLMGNADDFSKAKAFGGSRHGVIDAITNSESAKSAGDLSATLRKMGFDTATGQMQGDLDRMIGAGSGLLASSEAAQGIRNKDFAGLLGIGQQQQGQTQAKLDDLKARFDAAQGHDTEQLNILLSALGMSPYGKSENVEKETSGGGGTDFAQMGLGILSLLMALPASSDRNMKTDIVKVGKGAAGIPLYSYRYKGDPKTYPKVVGPMAQDIEKKFPGTTRTVDGKMTVPLGILAAING